MTWSGRRRKALDRLVDDLRSARNLEAYALSLLAFGLIIYSIVADPSDELFNAVLLACIGFLVISTIGARARSGEVQLTDVLRDRDSYGTFDQLLDDASELWMYAPSGVNVLLRHSADLRRWISAGGQARIVVHDPAAGNIDAVRAQLDDNTDFGKDLEASLAALDKLAGLGGLEYRLLPLNPGFGLVAINPRHRGGRVIVEFHGFQADDIGDRMHVEIHRSESTHWFDYWTGCFEAIWNAARPPRPPASVDPTDHVPAESPDHPEARTQ
jgi:hypothetical protein